MNTKTEQTHKVRLTQFSHGAGCGCKIPPATLDMILKNNETLPDYPNLLVGNHSRDDAAVYDLGNKQALISTTDFFMPIVDDAFDFGRIASANAISDVYAMGGSPIMAIAVLGWPVNKIPVEAAQQVITGSREICKEAGIPLAGGHSIDSPEPIFGLAVNGLVNTKNIKKNNSAVEGDFLFLTKPLGIGILSTAIKKNVLNNDHLKLAIWYMTMLNKVGIEIGELSGVHAMTDVTGFGLLGHLAEMTEGSNVSAEIYFKNIPIIPGIDQYIKEECIPGGTNRNWNSYSHKIEPVSEYVRQILCDPQTSGGLLVSISQKSLNEYTNIIRSAGIDEMACKPIGKIVKRKKNAIKIIE